MTDMEILEAVEQMRYAWNILFGDENAEALAGWLEAPRDNPEAARQAANRVLDLLQRYPEVKAQVIGEPGLKGPLEGTTRGLYEGPPGEQGDVPAGTLMVCPVDPSHYRQHLRQKGQRLFCPLHQKDLVPADSIEPEE